MRRAGADAVFAPYSITGHHMAQVLLRPHVLQFLNLTTKDIGMNVSIRASSHRRNELSGWPHHSAITATTRFWGRCSCDPRQQRRDALQPARRNPISAGGFLIVMGRQGDLQALENLLPPRPLLANRPSPRRWDRADHVRRGKILFANPSLNGLY